jgi:hypothetical protein
VTETLSLLQLNVPDDVDEVHVAIQPLTSSWPLLSHLIQVLSGYASPTQGVKRVIIQAFALGATRGIEHSFTDMVFKYDSSSIASMKTMLETVQNEKTSGVRTQLRSLSLTYRHVLLSLTFSSPLDCSLVAANHAGALHIVHRPGKGMCP